MSKFQVPSSKNRVIVYADGGSRGNPGPAAVGVVVCNAAEKKIKEYAYKLEDVATNNEAEYEAVVFALKKLKQLFGKEKTKDLAVDFRLDSELVASQLGGRYKIAEERLQMLFMKVWNLKFDFGGLSFKSIPREKNKRADELVNQALDGVGENSRLL